MLKNERLDQKKRRLSVSFGSVIPPVEKKWTTRAVFFFFVTLQDRRKSTIGKTLNLV